MARRRRHRASVAVTDCCPCRRRQAWRGSSRECARGRAGCERSQPCPCHPPHPFRPCPPASSPRPWPCRPSGRNARARRPRTASRRRPTRRSARAGEAGCPKARAWSRACATPLICTARPRGRSAGSRTASCSSRTCKSCARSRRAGCQGTIGRTCWCGSAPTCSARTPVPPRSPPCSPPRCRTFRRHTRRRRRNRTAAGRARWA
mmetsp:Transcript_10036/g.31697  ORF Transcript_10036/g.31697 Transcript_10036/m.31697 type:complete len:205 (+) Transcript_10036:765-1379(+)